MNPISSEPPCISIVVPVYNERDNILEFVSQVSKILTQSRLCPYEILFVDDGSTDQTWETIKLAHQLDAAVIGIRLLTNGGKEAALTAGLAHCRGSCAVPMDVDLQDPPELLPDMYRLWQNGAAGVVARRRTRNDGLIRNLASASFYKLVTFGVQPKIPGNVGDFRLLDRSAVDAFLSYPEVVRYNKGLLSLSSPDVDFIEYDRPESHRSGKARQSFLKLFRLAVEGIVSFTSWPLYALSFAGFALLIIATFGIAAAVVLRLLGLFEAPGQATIVLLVLFAVGIQSLTSGVLGLYLAQVLAEVKRRPLYTVSEVLPFEGAG